MPTLTARERDILDLLADGLTQVAIGRLLDVDVRTLRRATSRLYAKLGARTAAHAVAIVYRARPIDAPPTPDAARRWRAAGYRLALVPIEPKK